MGVQQHWSQTASSNSGADTLVNVAENQAPSTVNDAMRAMMAQIRKTIGDQSGGLVTGGSATAFTVTSNEVVTSLVDGMQVMARAHTASGVNPTLALDGTAAKSIKMFGTQAPHIGAIVSGGVYTFTYYSSGDVWLLSGGPPIAKFVGESFEWNSDTLPPMSVWENGQALSRTTYAALFAVIGTTFGSGDGSTTFNVPDSCGRVSAGQDDMGGISTKNRLPSGITGGVDGSALGNVGGEASHTLTGAESGQKAISAAPVSITDPGHFHGVAIARGANIDTGGGSQGSIAVSSTTNTDTKTTGITAAFTLSASSASNAHNIAQPTIIKNKCIFAGV